MNIKFFVNVKDINCDDIILDLLELGTIDGVLNESNTFIMTSQKDKKKKIEDSFGVKSVSMFQ